MLALDQHGQGDTDWAAVDRYGDDDMANDPEDFVRALGLENFALLDLTIDGMRHCFGNVRSLGDWNYRP